MTRLRLSAIYTLCTLLLCMDAPLLHAQNVSSIQMTLNSWYWVSGQEGFNLNADSTLELTTLMGEPVVKSVTAWNFETNSVYSVQVHFIPYGETEMTTRAVSLDNAREMIRPYAYRVKVKLPNDNFIEFDPGALSSEPEKPSFNPRGLRSGTGSFIIVSSPMRPICQRPGLLNCLNG